MSTIRELAESAYLIATSRPTNNTGIDVIEDAIQAAVNDHTRALADAASDARIAEWKHTRGCPTGECWCYRLGAALRAAGRL